MLPRKSALGTSGLLHRSVLLAALAAAALSGCSSRGSDLTDSDAIQREAEQAKESIVLPPGAAFRPINVDAGGVYQPGQGTQFIQYQAICAWFGYWLDGVENHKSDQVTSARDAISVMRGWPSWEAGATYLDDVTARAELGDPSGLKEMIANNCR